MSRFTVRVKTYSGYRADERPVSFMLGEREFRVAELVDRWYGPDYACFKLKADDGNLYLLRHHLDDDCWEMVMMEAEGAPAG